MGAVKSLESISRQLRQAEGAHRQVGERSLQLGADILGIWSVVRMPEHLDVLVKGLQVVLGMLQKCQLGKCPAINE